MANKKIPDELVHEVCSIMLSQDCKKCEPKKHHVFGRTVAVCRGKAEAVIKVVRHDMFLQEINSSKDNKFIKEDAKKILSRLNEKAGTRYRETETNLKFIVARLQDGIEVGQLNAVIAVKWR